MMASGVEKSYRRGAWPFRHSVSVLTEADIDLFPGEVVGLVGATGPARAR